MKRQQSRTPNIFSLQLIRQNFFLLKGALLSDISQRYAGSMAGIFWVFIYPVILFFIYATLYLFIFRIKPADMTSQVYMIYIMSGLLPFLGFSEGLTSGTMSLSNKKSLLLNTVYPSEFIPLQAVLASHVTLLVGIAMLVISHLVLLKTIHWSVLMVPYLIVLQVMFTTGIVWVLSILNLMIKDIQQTLSFLTMLLMIMSPIAYTPSMVPASLKFIMYLNPFSYYVWSYQDLFVNGLVSQNLIIATILSVCSFALGYTFYSKFKKVFYEFA